MVGFMLEDDGGEAADGVVDSQERSRIGVRDDGRGPARHRTAHAGDGKASLLPVCHGPVQGIYPHICIYLERLILLVESLDGHDPAADADLRARDSDPVLAWICHGPDHLAGKGPEFLRTEVPVGKIPGRPAQEQGVLPVRHSQDPHHVGRAGYQLFFSLGQGRT